MEQKKLDHILNLHVKHLNDHAAEKTELERKMSKAKFRKEKWDEKSTLGNRVADSVAKFGGSWSFIIVFALVLLVWMATNVVGIFHFDPYPFILLNLALSSLAAFQAPIIMMSQNRADAKNSLNARNDAKVNLQSNAKQDLIMKKIDHINNQLEDDFQLLSLIAEDQKREER